MLYYFCKNVFRKEHIKEWQCCQIKMNSEKAAKSTGAEATDTKPARCGVGRTTELQQRAHSFK
jgi:hypothetical protein